LKFSTGTTMSAAARRRRGQLATADAAVHGVEVAGLDVGAFAGVDCPGMGEGSGAAS
jgi:hypothetical protein